MQLPRRPLEAVAAGVPPRRPSRPSRREAEGELAWDLRTWQYGICDVATVIHEQVAVPNQACNDEECDVDSADEEDGDDDLQDEDDDEDVDRGDSLPATAAEFHRRIMERTGSTARVEYAPGGSTSTPQVFALSARYAYSPTRHRDSGGPLLFFPLLKTFCRSP